MSSALYWLAVIAVWALAWWGNTRLAGATGLPMPMARLRDIAVPAIFGLTVLFSLLTLPVELDASKRALRMLDESGLMQSEDDRTGARSVLRAAALTYLAAAVTAVLQLLYYISIARRRG